MKYESGENFESMAHRYAIIMNLLNFDLKIPTPQINDGEFVAKLRHSEYSESIERLLILYAYGMIDEKLLIFLSYHKKVRCEDVAQAEELVLQLETIETRRRGRYVEIDDEMVDLKSLHNALRMCAECENSDILSDIRFNKAYEICTAEHKHITIEEGFCIPDDYLKNFAMMFDDILAKFENSRNTIEELSEDPEIADDDKVVFKDAQTAVFMEYYIEKLFGRDYIAYCIDNMLSLEISEDEYRKYLTDKKLSFEFKKLTRRHCYFTSRYNHLDYSYVKTENGIFISKSEAPAETLTLRIDAAEVKSDDTARDIVIKLLKKNINTFPTEGTIMQTSYNNEVMIFAYSKGIYKEINYKDFISNIVDIGRVHELAQLFSNKHLIRLTKENDVEIIVSKDNIDYRQENDISDIEFEAVKGVVREQLARRFALERKKTESLRTMSQLKVDAENAKREEVEAKKRAEEEKQQKRDDEKAKREVRKKNGE